MDKKVDVCVPSCLCNQNHQRVEKKQEIFPRKKKAKIPKKTLLGTMPAERAETAITLFSNTGEGSAHNKYLRNVRGALSRSHIRNPPLNAFLHQR